MQILLANPTIITTTITPVFSQEEGSSVSIAPGAADPNNGLSFDPPQINVPTGSIVSWTNSDSIQHTVTSDEQGLFDAGPISPGDTFENVFDSAGEFGYMEEDKSIGIMTLSNQSEPMTAASVDKDALKR